MKVFGKDKVYVQRVDIACLYYVNIDMPKSIAVDLKETFKMNEKNQYDFLEFSGESELEFFKNASWIIDYEQVKDLKDDEKQSVIEDALIENRSIKNYLEIIEKDENKDEEYINKVRKLLDYKINSLFMYFSLSYECFESKLPKEFKPKETLKEKILRRIQFRPD